MKFSFYLLTLMLFVPGAQSHLAQTRIDIQPKVAKQLAGVKYGCLPEDIKPETVVEAKQIKSTVGIRILKETVSQRLSKLGARCKAGKLVYAKGKEIRFYKLQTCWGNPPADYLEIVETEKNNLLRLRKKFLVIEITCNPSGLMPV